MTNRPNQAIDIHGCAKTLHAGMAVGKVDVAELPASLPLATALEVQLAVLDLHLRSGETLGGWKVGLTSGPAREKMGEGFRPFGYLLGSKIYSSGSDIELEELRDGGLETELAFLFKQPLKGGFVGPEDVRAAIAGVVPAFEIQQYRVPAGGDHGLDVANDLSQWAIVVGDVIDWTSSAQRSTVELLRDGELVSTVGPNFPIDEPMDAIANACRLMNNYGFGIEVGQYVITGAFQKERLGHPGTWTGRFSNAGEVEIRFV